MTYVNNDVLLAMSQEWVWEGEVDEFHPPCCLVVVKLFPAAPVYAMATVYIPTVQERLHFLTVLSGLHKLQMEAVALVYMPKDTVPTCLNPLVASTTCYFL